ADVDEQVGYAGAILDQRDRVVLSPGRAVLAEVAGERFLPPRHLPRRNDRSESRDAAEATREAERRRQRAMSAHRMAGDALAVHVDRELGGQEAGQLVGDIGPHAIVRRPRLLRRIDVEAGAQTEVPLTVRRAGHALA